MANYKISAPRLRVLRGSLDAPEVLEVQTLNPDMVLWDMTRYKHKWPGIQDAPFKWLTFVSWAAARREQMIPADLTYEEWEASTLNVENLDGEDGPQDTVAPFLGDPGPDSLSS